MLVKNTTPLSEGGGKKPLGLRGFDVLFMGRLCSWAQKRYRAQTGLKGLVMNGGVRVLHQSFAAAEYAGATNHNG